MNSIQWLAFLPEGGGGGGRLPDGGGRLPDGGGGTLPDGGGKLPDLGGRLPEGGGRLPDLGGRLPDGGGGGGPLCLPLGGGTADPIGVNHRNCSKPRTSTQKKTRQTSSTRYLLIGLSTTD